MADVSLLRLYVLRATYLFIVVGLGFMIWPALLSPPANTEHMRGVVRSVLAAVSLLALVGLRYPLQMLPLLFFELLWKSIWILAIGLPLWSASELDSAHRQTWTDCLISIVLFLLAIPWGYVLTHYVRQPGAPWKSGSADPTSSSAGL